MQRLMRRPSSWATPNEPAGHGSICTLSKSSMPRRRIAACQSGCSFTPMIASIASPKSSAGRMPSCTVHDRTSPAVTDTTTSIASSRPGGTSSASTSRSTGAPAVVREHHRLVGLVQAQVREHEVGLVAVVGRDQRDRGA